MSGIGTGVREIRLRQGGEHRVIYVAKLEEAVYVLHTFEKNPTNPEAGDRASENEIDRDQGAKETAMKGITHVTLADSNVFADLGIKDAENLKLRAQLMIEIGRYIKEHGLTQAEAAKRMCTTQPRINDIVQGRIEKCPIDRLVNMLAAVGHHVSLAVGKAA